MPILLSPALQLLGRILLAAIFIMGGYGKLGTPGPTTANIASSGLPFPQLAYWIAVVVELGGGLAILLGFQTRLAALVLAGWCIVTGFLFHYQPGVVGQMINFNKNLAMAGGFLQLVALGAGAWSLDALLRRRIA